MSKLDETSTVISFQGDDVHSLLKENFLMHQAIWGACNLLDAKVTVHVSPRIEATGRLEWQVVISSPAGRRSINAIQRRLTSSVEFTSDNKN